LERKKEAAIVTGTNNPSQKNGRFSCILRKKEGPEESDHFDGSSEAFQIKDVRKTFLGKKTQQIIVPRSILDSCAREFLRRCSSIEMPSLNEFRRRSSLSIESLQQAVLMSSQGITDFMGRNNVNGANGMNFNDSECSLMSHSENADEHQHNEDGDQLSNKTKADTFGLQQTEKSAPKILFWRRHREEKSMNVQSINNKDAAVGIAKPKKYFTKPSFFHTISTSLTESSDKISELQAATSNTSREVCAVENTVSSMTSDSDRNQRSLLQSTKTKENMDQRRRFFRGKHQAEKEDRPLQNKQSKLISSEQSAVEANPSKFRPVPATAA